jgi:pimeloyl-ACP methyl ester carboxylesterase
LQCGLVLQAEFDLAGLTYSPRDGMSVAVPPEKNISNRTMDTPMSAQHYKADGIFVERYTSPKSDSAPSSRPPVLLVHGGCHAAWCWSEHAPIYSSAGYEVHALNWLGRGGSDLISDAQLTEASFPDVVEDIEKVAGQLAEPPILIAHSMGALAAQLYAMKHNVRALVLLTPVVPSNVGATPIEIPIDLAQPWGPPPPEVARQLFFQGLDDEASERAFGLLVHESSRRVYDATRWTVPVDVSKFNMPMMVLSGALDVLTPPDTGEKLARLYGADYHVEPELGHNVLLGSGARRVAEKVTQWLDARF